MSLKEILKNTAILVIAPYIVSPIIYSVFDTNKTATPESFSAPASQVQYANWVRCDDNKNRRKPTFLFYENERVSHSMHDENAYVKEVEQRNNGLPDSLWEYPDLDGNGRVGPR